MVLSFSDTERVSIIYPLSLSVGRYRNALPRDKSSISNGIASAEIIQCLVSILTPPTAPQAQVRTSLNRNDIKSLHAGQNTIFILLTLETLHEQY